MVTFVFPHGDRDMGKHIFFRYLHGKEKDGAAGEEQVDCFVFSYCDRTVPGRIP